MNSRLLCIFTFLIILQAVLPAAESFLIVLPAALPVEESSDSVPEDSSDSVPEEPNIAAINETNNDIYFLSVRRNEGSTVGDRISYTTLEAFSFPYNYKNFYPFVDLRYHGFGESSQNAANAGLGFRFAPNCTDVILGANVYYDYRKVHNCSFNQIGIGFESLGPRLNFRINGYLPFGKQSWHSSSKYFEYPGEYFMICKKFADSLRGLDFEAEMLIANICCTDIYFAIGGYYYEKKKCGKKILGSEYRLTVYPPSCFSFSVCATHDCKTRVQAEITFTYPFRCKGNAEAFSTCFLPVQRREMIVLDRRDMYNWNW